MSQLSDYLQNKIVDWLMRGQSFTPPSTVYVGLFTTAVDATGAGTEVTGGSYARASVACNMTNWAGTQGAGSTTASSGTSGLTSNNADIAFPTPSANWGLVTHFGVFDAPSGGNLLFFAELAVHRTINNGDLAPSIPPANLTFIPG